MDLNKVKSIANSFLHLEMEQNKEFPIFVHHPFFDSIMICDKEGIFNVLEEPERYDRFLSNYNNMFIKKADSLTAITRLIRNNYKVCFLRFLYESNAITLKECGNELALWWSFVNVNHDVNVSKTAVMKWLKAADKESLMDNEDYTVYNNLPDKVTVYRGVQEKDHAKGFNWSLSKEVATRFATDIAYKKEGIVCETTVDRKDIIAYTDQRNEKEIILDYKKLDNIKFTKVKSSREIER